MVRETKEKIRIIHNHLNYAQYHQKVHADRKRKEVSY